MKRLLYALALSALLCGCAVLEPPPTAAPTEPTVVTEETLPPVTLLQSRTEKVSLYTPESGTCSHILPWNDGRLAMLTTNGQLLILSGDTLLVEQVRDLGCPIRPDCPAPAVKGDQLGYYDSVRQAYVTLGKNLTELSSVSLWGEVSAGPVISADFSTLYYGSGNDLRAVDMASGTSRLLRQQHTPIDSVQGLLSNGRVLCCAWRTPEGQNQTSFLRTDDGSLVTAFPGVDCQSASTQDGWAAVLHMELPLGSYHQILSGNAEGEIWEIVPQESWTDALLAGEDTVVVQRIAHNRLTLELYDLTAGKLLDTVTIDKGTAFPRAWNDGNRLWLWDETQVNFYCWDFTPGESETENLNHHYTLAEPQAAALKPVLQQIQTMKDQYGVKIGIYPGSNRTPGVDYTTYPDYRAELYVAALELLDETLSQLPEGLLTRFEKPLSIQLTDDFDPSVGGVSHQGSMENNDELIIKVGIGPELPTIFYHELCHAMEAEIYKQTNDLMDWEKLNPKDFDYALSYEAVEKDSPLLETGINAFVVDYGMVSPREDRATIFMYAMMDSQKERFNSPTMQEKLEFLCELIREVFSLEEAQALPWEQHLIEGN